MQQEQCLALRKEASSERPGNCLLAVRSNFRQERRPRPHPLTWPEDRASIKMNLGSLCLPSGHASAEVAAGVRYGIIFSVNSCFCSAGASEAPPASGLALPDSKGLPSFIARLAGPPPVGPDAKAAESALLHAVCPFLAAGFLLARECCVLACSAVA